MNSKSDIRTHYRQIRRHIPASVRKTASIAAAACLMAHPRFHSSTHVACYLPSKEEVDTQAIITALWQAGKKCYLPILLEGKSLGFARYQQNDILHENQYAILEPMNPIRKIRPEKLDIVILPLIAFDRQGHRLGTGGGYYDRTFAFLHAEHRHRPLLFGLAYREQEAEILPSDPWDVVLDGVITENGIISMDTAL